MTIGMDRRPLVVTFDLGEHDFAVIEVVQRGIDVEVLDPGGPCLEGPWSVDLRKGDSGTESVPVASTSAAQPSELRLIPAAEPDAGAGEVLLRITDARQQPRARDHCRGWRAFLDGRVAALDRSAEAQLQAVSEYRRSAEIFRSLEDDAALGQALLNQAAAEHRLGRMDEALHHLSEARRRLASAESDSSRRNLVAAWIETSWIWLRKGQVELASELFGEAARLAEALGDRRSLAMALNGQGLAHKRAEDWPRAVEAYRRAAQLAEGNRCVESAARTNLGRAHTKLGEFQRGLSELSRAVELALPQSDGDSACRDLAAALNSKASLYGALGRWQIAASTFEEALRFASETMRLRLLGNYARALARVGQPDQARDVYLESIETASRTGNRDVEFATRLNLGHLYLREFDDPHRAAQQYELATAFVDPAESSRDLAHLSVLRAQLFLETSRPERAREQAIRAVELASRLGDVQQEAFAQLLLARSQLARGDAETAAATAATAVDTIEGLRSRTASFDLRATFLAERNDYFETWIRALVELHRRDASGGFAARALEVAERARSRAFLDMLDQADVERSA
ncbi:MAG: tetratricopeptide repeat protein, partial [Thermoanaerobaculia bacterium]|nr:tetratricopeptide repeat protein [Thermoanaerobaculia bacterium]